MSKNLKENNDDDGDNDDQFADDKESIFKEEVEFNGIGK